jgi:hypothetical protein
MPRARQPIRVATGLPYGERKAQEEMQASAPMGAAPVSPVETPTAAAPVGPPMPAGGAFRPTERPDEPITAGIPSGPGSLGDNYYLGEDPNALLRSAYRAWPDPWILRLLQEDNAPDPFFKPLKQKTRFTPPPPRLKPAQ